MFSDLRHLRIGIVCDLLNGRQFGINILHGFQRSLQFLHKRVHSIPCKLPDRKLREQPPEGINQTVALRHGLSGRVCRI